MLPLKAFCIEYLQLKKGKNGRVLIEGIAAPNTKCYEFTDTLVT